MYMEMEAIFTSRLITVLSRIAHNCPLVPVQSQADGRQSPSLHNKVIFETSSCTPGARLQLLQNE